tara:strand:- start:207 stop:1193 length:987 start_codon:yes stop_codon:yes gene_type:complete
MKEKLYKKIYSEDYLINKYLKKLSFNKSETFNFENDAAYLNLSKHYSTIVTTDTIVESIDFFSSDPPESIAQKIVCVNISDLSAMGAFPISYTLNLSLKNNININWIKKFINRLYKLQKKYNFFLLGGDISKSKETNISATFFGKCKSNKILSQNNCKLGDNLWITGNLGNSYIGYKLLTNSKIKIDKKLKNKFINCYRYPSFSLFGYYASKYINAAIDISDGFYGDLKKILNNKKGAKICLNSIPINKNLNFLLKLNSQIKLNNILNWGDDYQLIFTSNKKNTNKLINLSKKHNIKISKIGKIIRKTGIYDDSLIAIENVNSYDHFS